MPTTEAELTGEFASTMQQLVAEAEMTIAPSASVTNGSGAVPNDGVQNELSMLNERIAGLARLIAANQGKPAALPNDTGDLGAQMQRMEGHLLALRGTETMNQRLFNSLHEELKSYRDNFLRESLQKPFIRDLVVLFDDLSSLSAQMESSVSGAEGKQGIIGQWHDNLENAVHSLIEVLHRMEVNEIEPREMVDRAFHRVVSYEPADFAEDDGRIVMRIKRGFVWHDQVLRPEEVVAKRFD